MRFLIPLLLLSFPSFADVLNVTWVQPTTREDGSPLAPAEIKHYRVVWTAKGVSQPDKIAPVGTSYALDTGTLTGRVCVTLYTVDQDNLESVASNTSCRNAKPNPPGQVVVR